MRRYEEDFNEEYERGYRAGRREALRESDEASLEESFAEESSSNKTFQKVISVLDGAGFTKEEFNDSMVFTGDFFSVKFRFSQSKGSESVVVGQAKLITSGEISLGRSGLDTLDAEVRALKKVRDLNRREFTI